MPITINDVKWGSYKDYEGPYFLGKYKFNIPKNPTIEEKIVYAITATEGGTFDAVNCYDKCIMSISLVQFCDRFHLATKLLGYIVENLGTDVVMKHIKNAGFDKKFGINFGQNENKQWRWFKNGVECKSLQSLRDLYLGGSSGKKGEWSIKQKNIAMQWVVIMANIWDNKKARNLQLKYIASKINLFTYGKSKEELIESNKSWIGWPGAVKALYISYSANNPAEANRLVLESLESNPHFKWSENWSIQLIKDLALKSNFSIWPNRYNHIRPVIEKLYGVILPKNSEELRLWTPKKSERPSPVSIPPPISGSKPKKINNDMIVTSPQTPSHKIKKEPTKEYSNFNDINDIKPIPKKTKENTSIFIYRKEWGIFKYFMFIIKLLVKLWFQKK
jgi:hypothetical protein